MTELHSIRDFLRFALSEFGRHPIELGHGTDSLWDEALALVFGAVSLPPDGDERLLDAAAAIALHSLHPADGLMLSTAQAFFVMLLTFA